jgi:hypothetical protein
LRLTINWPQRIIAIAAGVLLLLFAFSSASSFDGPDSRLATVQFFLAAVCFVFAASPKSKGDDN